MKETVEPKCLEPVTFKNRTAPTAEWLCSEGWWLGLENWVNQAKFQFSSLRERPK